MQEKIRLAFTLCGVMGTFIWSILTLDAQSLTLIVFDPRGDLEVVLDPAKMLHLKITSGDSLRCGAVH